MSSEPGTGTSTTSPADGKTIASTSTANPNRTRL